MDACAWTARFPIAQGIKDGAPAIRRVGDVAASLVNRAVVHGERAAPGTPGTSVAPVRRASKGQQRVAMRRGKDAFRHASKTPPTRSSHSPLAATEQ
eukprot:6502232-Pyramimonas_sp.AAC.1